MGAAYAGEPLGLSVSPLEYPDFNIHKNKLFQPWSYEDELAYIPQVKDQIRFSSELFTVKLQNQHEN